MKELVTMKIEINGYSKEATKIRLLIEAWHNTRHSFNEILIDAKAEWEKKNAVCNMYQYDPNGYSHIRKAIDKYYTWLEENVFKYGISLTTNNETGEPLGLCVSLAGKIG